MSSPSPAAAPPLLVRLPNPLGDALMATPLLTALHRAEPARPLVLAGRPDASTRWMERVVMATYTLAQVLLGLGLRRLVPAQPPTAV